MSDLHGGDPFPATRESGGGNGDGLQNIASSTGATGIALDELGREGNSLGLSVARILFHELEQMIDREPRYLVGWLGAGCEGGNRIRSEILIVETGDSNIVRNANTP